MFFCLSIINTYSIHRYVSKWSKKFDPFDQDKIFCPLNIDNGHWVMVVVFMQQQEVHFYDSMSGDGEEYMGHILHWLRDQARANDHAALDTSNWITRCPGELLQVPQQHNGVDCGIFSMLAADYLSDRLPLTYSQGDIPLFRAKIAVAITKGELSY
jgi:Ulp1 family protease